MWDIDNVDNIIDRITSEGFSEFDDSAFVTLEGAHFTIFPDFGLKAKRYPALNKHEGVIRESEKLLNSKGTTANAAKYMEIARKNNASAQDICYAIEAGVAVGGVALGSPAMVFLGIGFALYTRALKMLVDQKNFTAAEIQTNKMINDMQALKAKTKNPKVKAKCDDEIKKLNEHIKELDVKKNKVSLV